jgi:hypothetical protein
MLELVTDETTLSPGVRRVVADTHATNFPLRIALIGAGMRRVGADVPEPL